jgi:hypothetical protein
VVEEAGEEEREGKVELPEYGTDDGEATEDC